jgi:nitroreductase family protein
VVAPAVSGWVVGLDGTPGPPIRACLEAATLAPSIHNSQPWRFRVSSEGVDVFADRGRSLGVVDPTGRELLMSVGAAVFNLRTAMRAAGRSPVHRLFPLPEADLVARVRPGAFASPSETVRLLAQAIPRRHTNRWPFTDVPVPGEVLAELADAAGVEGCSLSVADLAGRAAVVDVARQGQRRQRQNPRYWFELLRWTVGDPSRRDGVPPAAFGPYAAVESVPLRDFGLVGTARRRRVERYERVPTFAVLSTDSDRPESWVRAGQAMQRVLLTATVRGLATTPMTQPVEVAELRAMLASVVGGGLPQVVIRLGYGPLCSPAPRRNLDDVLMAN